MFRGIRIKINLFFLLVLGLSLTIIGDMAWAQGDWQYWNAQNFKKTINEKVDLRLSIFERFNKDMHDLFYGGFQIGPVFKINKYLDVYPNFCYIQTKDSKGHFRPERRPTLDVNLKWKMNMFKFTHRSRLEYRFLKALSRWRYRDYIMAGIPFSVYKHSVMPYVSGEIFYEERKNEFNQYRVSSGVSINITKDIVFDIYYVLRRDKASTSSGDWLDTNVLGTALTFNF